MSLVIDNVHIYAWETKLTAAKECIDQIKHDVLHICYNAVTIEYQHGQVVVSSASKDACYYVIGRLDHFCQPPGDVDRKEVPNIFVNQWVDAQDRTGDWHEAQVRYIHGKRALVHFKGQRKMFDELIPIQNLRYINTHTEKEKKWTERSHFQVLKDLFVIAPDGVTSRAQITKIRRHGFDIMIKVHYNSQKSKHDEWLHWNSWRIQNY